MRTLTITLLTAGLLWATAPAAVAETRGSFDQVVADAQTIRTEALDVKRLLKDKSADPTAVAQRVATLEAHAKSLKTALAYLQGDQTLTPSQRAAVDKAMAATEPMIVILNNKLSLLADAEKAAKQRGLLRDKADGIAKRAQMVERQITAVIG